jgi:hypothetical protein
VVLTVATVQQRFRLTLVPDQGPVVGRRMGAWGTGNFENDGSEGWLQSLCQPVLEEVRTILADVAQLRQDVGQGLVPAKIQLLAAVWEEANRADRGVLDTPLYPFSLPSARQLRSWRRAYLTAWEAEAGVWGTETRIESRRRTIEDSFDRIIAVATGVERELRQRRAATEKGDRAGPSAGAIEGLT